MSNPYTKHKKDKEVKYRFWENKSLKNMSNKEWESLCDGCGRCCVHKYEVEETGELFESKYACELLDCNTCQCTDYANRIKRVKHCKVLTPDMVGKLTWLPETCAYRLLDEGKKLPSWHPLITGTSDTVHKLGISVAGRVTPLSQLDAMIKMAADLDFVERFRKIQPRNITDN